MNKTPKVSVIIATHNNVMHIKGCLDSLGHAKNTGLYRVRAPYVIFVEPDDYIDPETLELLLESPERFDAEMEQRDVTRRREGDMDPLWMLLGISADEIPDGFKKAMVVNRNTLDSV